ncbi:MAG: tetratricopeptide repeat protein [Deltaproteobacteria bacterium]|nr:tetratricopeptide repeat protein [Deltaproteobacteria bacterium]
MAAVQEESSSESQKVDVLLDKGVVQFALGNHDAAHSRWQEALELDPGNERAHDYLRTVADGGAGNGSGFRDDQATEAMTAISEENLAAVGGAASEDSDPGSDSLVPPFGREVTFDDDAVRTDDLAVEPVVPDVEIMLRDARKSEGEGRLEEALTSAEDALKRDPEREETQVLVASLKGRLREVYLEELHPLERVPVLRATDASILELSLDPIGGFLISQIDGEITIEELLTILGTFDEFRVLGSLHFFLKSGIIELR